MPRTPRLSAKLHGFATTVFSEMSALAVAHGAVNLGQGFPDFGPPAEVLAAARAAIADGHNQYAPGNGVPALRQAIADQRAGDWGTAYDPDHEVTVTTGATEAVFATLQGLLDVGDEVVVFEPFYDSYLPSIAMAGAVVRPVTLRAPDWCFDEADLRAAVTPRTRVILLNSPHNPTGKVFTREEIALVADLALEHDLVVVADEVYEHLVFGVEHVPIASLPGMRERTVAISSAGKTFSCTGWKVGWTCAPAELTHAVRTAKQFVTFTSGTPFQHAIAVALGLGPAFLDDFRRDYTARRDRLVAGLEQAGFTVLPPQGTYFVACDATQLGQPDDVAFCRSLPGRAGVAAIPMSVFGADPRTYRGLVRFAFCKTDPVLDEGIARLAALRTPNR